MRPWAVKCKEALRSLCRRARRAGLRLPVWGKPAAKQVRKAVIIAWLWLKFILWPTLQEAAVAAAKRVRKAVIIAWLWLKFILWPTLQEAAVAAAKRVRKAAVIAWLWLKFILWPTLQETVGALLAALQWPLRQLWRGLALLRHGLILAECLCLWVLSRVRLRLRPRLRALYWKRRRLFLPLYLRRKKRKHPFRERAARRKKPLWLRLLLRALLWLLLGYVLAYGGECIRQNASAAAFFAERSGALHLTALLLALTMALLTLLTDVPALAFLLTAAADEAFAVANYSKLVLNGSPVSLEDLRLLGSLGHVTEVAGTLPLPERLWPVLAVTALLFLLLCLLSPFLRGSRGRLRFLLFTAALGAFLYGVCDDGAAALGRRFSLDMENRQAAELSYEDYGAVAGIFRDWAVDRAFYIEEYSEQYMREVLERIDARLAEQEAETLPFAEQPNVILLLEEAQFDISAMPQLDFTGDPNECYHALAAESRTGTFYSRYLGFGTGYIEMGVLSGLQSRYFAAGSNICFLPAEDYTAFAALPACFRAQGYTTVSFHSHNNSLYRRPENFAALGFTEALFQDDMEDYWLHGAYIADEYLLETVFARLTEENAAGNKAFLYGITMENHQPYTAEKFSEGSGVTVSSPVLSGEALTVMQSLTDGTAYADRALGGLIDRLREYDEPVLLVAYGDHRPNLSVGETENVYHLLGITESADMSEMSLDELRTLYTTDYLIWSNDATVQRVLAGSEGTESYATLGASLLRMAGIPMSRYWRLLDLCRSAALADSDRYFADSEGKVYETQSDAALTEEQTELLTLLRAVIYDACCGEKYITEEMNREG